MHASVALYTSIHVQMFYMYMYMYVCHTTGFTIQVQYMYIVHACTQATCTCTQATLYMYMYIEKTLDSGRFELVSSHQHMHNLSGTPPGFIYTR